MDLMITHPDKLLFPKDGITKGELAAYYEMIAPVMLPHLRRRPITMERFHRGIDAPGFFQKDVSKGFPAWLKRVEVPKKDGTVHHPVANDTRSLQWLANQNSITIHVWPSRAPRLITRTSASSIWILRTKMNPTSCAWLRSGCARCSLS